MIAKDSFIILQSGTELTGALCRVGLKSRDVSYLHHVTCADRSRRSGCDRLPPPGSRSTGWPRRA